MAGLIKSHRPERGLKMSTKRKNEGMDRREFIKGAALAGGALTLSALMPGDAEAKGMVPAKWTIEADVIIVGFGGAGACAAIEAHDAGAKVLILEKQPEKRHYPNTRMSGGIFHSPDPTGDRAALKEYAKAMFSGENLPWKLEGEEPEVSDELAEAWAEYSPKNIEFMRKIDPDFNAAARGSAAFPNFPGAKASKYASVRSTYTGRMSYEYPTKDLPKKEKMAGEAFFTCLKTGIENRKIKVLYETPVKSLVV
jgi:3-oxosteroid 1-dehydrogenase